MKNKRKHWDSGIGNVQWQKMMYENGVWNKGDEKEFCEREALEEKTNK